MKYITVTRNHVYEHVVPHAYEPARPNYCSLVRPPMWWSLRDDAHEWLEQEKIEYKLHWWGGEGIFVVEFDDDQDTEALMYFGLRWGFGNF